jgi:maltose/maltodextrin transport system substrate-binding protein
MNILNIIISGLLCLLSLPTLEAQTSVLEIWTSSENIKRALTKQALEFEKDYQTKVVITVLNKELKTQFQTAGLSEKGPDILCWAHDVVGELANSGLIEPLVIHPDVKKDILPQALKAFEFEGKYYGLPYALESLALIRNIKMMPKAPESFEQLFKISQEIRQKNSAHYGLLFELKNFYFSSPVLAVGTQGLFEKDELGRVQGDRPIITSNEQILNAQFLQSLSQAGLIPPSVDRSIAFELFTQGKVGAIIDGPWTLATLNQSGLDFEVSVIPTLRGKKARPFVGTHGFMIRRSSPNKALSLELIERYFMSKEGVAEIYREDPRAPTRADSLEQLRSDLSEKEIRQLEGFMLNAQQGIPMPNIPQMGAIWPAMGEALEFMIQNNEEPEKSLRNASVKLIERP